MKLVVCTMKRSPPLSSCGNRGGEKVYVALKIKLAEQAIPVEVEQIKCLGYCEEGPNVSAASTGKMWSKVNENALDKIIEFCKSRMDV